MEKDETDETEETKEEEKYFVCEVLILHSLHTFKKKILVAFTGHTKLLEWLLVKACTLLEPKKLEPCLQYLMMNCRNRGATNKRFYSCQDTEYTFKFKNSTG